MPLTGNSYQELDNLNMDCQEDEKLLEEFSKISLVGVKFSIGRERRITMKASSRAAPRPTNANSVNSSTTTHFFCPLSPCMFRTSKKGMKEGLAARHLKEEHEVTGAMMKKSNKGTFKFRKF